MVIVPSVGSPRPHPAPRGSGRGPAVRRSRITVRSGQWRADQAAGESMSMMRPWSMIATRSHSRSASSIRCVVSNTVFPRSRIPRTDPGSRAGPEDPDRSSARRGTPLGIVDEREGDEQALLLAAGQRHEPGVALVAEAELLEQPSGSRRAVERRQRSTASHTLIASAAAPPAAARRCGPERKRRRETDRARAREMRPTVRRRSPSTHPSSWSCRRRSDRSGRRSRRLRR